MGLQHWKCCTLIGQLLSVATQLKSHTVGVRSPSELGKQMENSYWLFVINPACVWF